MAELFSIKKWGEWYIGNLSDSQRSENWFQLKFARFHLEIMLKFMKRQEMTRMSAQLAPFVSNQPTIFRVDTNVIAENQEKLECSHLTPFTMTHDLIGWVPYN